MEHNKQGYIKIAIDYLSPVLLIELQIQSIRKEINQLRNNITSIGAIDYSKDKVSGGRTSVGIEASVAKFLDVAKEKEAKIEQLTQQYCEVSTMIDSLTEVIGAIILRYEYLLGLPTKEVYRIVGYGETQGDRYKKLALIELGKRVGQSEVR